MIQETNNILHQYVNGDYTFTIYEDGTLIRETEVDNPKITFPSSMDIKITDYCDMGCVFCHESSTKKGVHGDLDKLLEIVTDIPAGVEFALGGGNPLSHPNLFRFLRDLKDKGIISNITVNQGHLKLYQNLLIELICKNLVKGIGISISNNNYKYIKPLLTLTNNIVYHLIAGINDISDIDKLIELNGNKPTKVLILGYKKFGFGINYHNPNVDANIEVWKYNLRKYFGKAIISFDNLAIEQLNVRKHFTKEGWDMFYMGDDFKFTMYIDGVKQEYAQTSRSIERKSFNECSLLEFFGQGKSI